jgi:hypothetical protein
VTLNWCTEAHDLGILADIILLFHQRISNIAHKVSVSARLILRSFCFKDCNIVMNLLPMHGVWPLLEYCSSVWSVFTAANINKIEVVRRHFTKNTSELTCCYNDRLFNLKLKPFEIRRLKYDLFTSYKSIHDSFVISERRLSFILY